MIDGIDWIGDGRRRASRSTAAGSRAAPTASPRAHPSSSGCRPGSQAKRARGYGEDDVWFVTPAEIEAEVRVAGVLGGTYTPHCARVDPARLARGLAEACERRGVDDLRALARDRASRRDASPAPNGSLRAEVVVRATEAFTTRLPGERRSYLPLASHMLATEPLPAETWDEIGWAGCAPDRRPALPVRLRPADAGRADRARRPRAHLPARRRDPRGRRGAARDPRPARAGAASPLPGRGSGARHAIAGAASSPRPATGA